MFDYKSIALPAELQGHNVNFKFFSLISQLKQCIKTIAYPHFLPRGKILINKKLKCLLKIKLFF